MNSNHRFISFTSVGEEISMLANTQAGENVIRLMSTNLRSRRELGE